MGKTAKRPHILVINDSQEMLDVMRELLEEEGFRVSMHSRAIRDLETFREIGPDLVILDHMMGDEEYGWQIIQKLRLDRGLAELPIVVCTAAAKMVQELEGHLKAKGIAVVLKPFDIDELMAAVRIGLDSKGTAPKRTVVPRPVPDKAGGS